MRIESLYCNKCKNNKLHYQPVDGELIYICMSCNEQKVSDIVDVIPLKEIETVMEVFSELYDEKERS